MLRRGVTVLLVALAAAVPASGAPDAGTPRPDDPPLVLRRSADVPGRLDAGVASIARVRRAGGAAPALREARLRDLDVSGGSVQVVVTAQPGRTAAVRDLVRSVGGRVVREYDLLVKAFVPVTALETVGRDTAVQFVAEPLRVHSFATTGQGVAASRASLSLPAGVNGSGVKVAVVDGGFQGLAALQASGDLPAGVTTKSYCDGAAIENGDEHGAGVAEIVHEVAPGAELYLICIEDQVDLGLAKDYVIANGIRIVNFSAGFYSSSRGDGSGAATTPDGIVAQARASGVLWVNAAGNEARSHWSGSFVDAGGGFNAFAPGDVQIGFTVPVGEWACLLLKWDAWPKTTTEDFDLGVYDSTGTLVAASTAFQNPDNLPPREDACFTNIGPGTAFGAAIRRDVGTSPRLDLFVVNAVFDEYRTAAGSLLEPASSPNALAVGAVCWLDDSLQLYSSQGPTIDGRVKPDVAGFDATSTATFGVSSSCSAGFRGTSAAAPHVAGIAALLLHRNAALTTPAAVQAELEALAVDLGAAGKDNLYGAGKLRTALPALNGLLAASTLSGGSDSDLYTIKATGLSRTTIAGDDATQETQPAWSGDGSRLVLARDTLGTPFWSINPDGTGLTPLAPLPASAAYPMPSPDGTMLAFVRDGDLYLGAADGSGAVQIAPGTLIRSPAWTPDGATLAFEDAGDIYTVAATGGPVSALFGTLSVEGEPAWSRDGTKIAFTKDDRIYVAAANGSSPTPLATNGSADRHPAWSPDGTKLAFARWPICCPSGNADIYVANADGTGTASSLTSDTTSDWVSWQPVVPPSVASRPAVAGTAQAGTTLTGDAGAWRGTYPLSLAYQWLRCDSAGAGCSAIAGATALTYAATTADAGSSLRLAVTATNTVRSVTATSHFSGSVSAPPAGGGGSGGGSGGGGGGGGGSADLGIEGWAQPVAVAMGEELTFHLRVTDVNVAVAFGVKIDVELPAGVQLVGSYADRGPGCAGAPLVCDLDFLSSVAPVGTIMLRAKVTASGELALKASVRYSAADPKPENNTVTILANRAVTPTTPVPIGTTVPTTKTGTAGANTLRGTARADTLRGLGGNDILYGLGGNDRLFGGSGNDRLFGGLGRDLLDGGPGNDTISARDHTRDTIRCGRGRDTVTADRSDTIARDCERVTRR